MAALTMTVETYRDRVLGAWRGKSAGLTFGQPLRGQMIPGRNNFYSPVPGQPASSAALDFPLVWLAVMEQVGPDVAPPDLAVAWLEHLSDYAQEEFGYAALNLRRGLPPPASGAYANWFRHGTGAAMRADFWAMIAPGSPQMAAAYAWHDATMDHAEDGEWAAMFLAAVGSASFFLTDPVTLLTIGLAMIPRTCRTARAVKAAIAAWHRAASWLEARESVLNEVKRPNFSDAAQNMGFFTIGLLYGGGDFGATVCAGANCGYDAETVGGALGAILGIQKGLTGLPEAWLMPVGDVYIAGMGLRDLDTPATLFEIADRTAQVGRAVVRDRVPDLEIAEVAAPLSFAFVEEFKPSDPPADPLAPPASPGEAEPVAPALPSIGEASSPVLDVPVAFSAPAALVDTPAPSVVPAHSDEASELPTVASNGITGSQQQAVSAPQPPADLSPDDLRRQFEARLSGSAVPPGSSQVPTPNTESQSPDAPRGLADMSIEEADAAAESSADEALAKLEAQAGYGVLRPQAVSEEPALAPVTGTPEGAALPLAAVAPDYTGAVAWADSSKVKPLLVTPPNALVGQAGPFSFVLDTGEGPVIAHDVIKTVTVTVTNRGSEPFSGRLALLAPPGWQIVSPPVFGQRQFIAAHTGTLRAEFQIRVPEGQGRIEIANAVTVRLTPEGGGASQQAEFVLLGASCWWVVGPFANYDGEGFDRSYLPEDRPGLNETYVSRLMQSARWERRAFTDATLDLEPFFKQSSGVCYGQTVLRSPTNREARIVANSNTGVKVWLNGVLILRRNAREPFRPHVGQGNWAVDVALKQGDNALMVKWVRGSEPAEFSLTVADRFGRGLPEVGNTSW